MQGNTSQFYSQLPVNRSTLTELLVNSSLFYTVPGDWYVIITDIKNSTNAVKNGLHENVNLVAAGSIVAILNLAFKENISIPFFFGGDGATFLIPPVLIDKAIPALLLYKMQTQENFNLELRVGYIPVSEIYTKNHQLIISKFSFSAFFPIPIVLGTGLNYAESIIKGNNYLPGEHKAQDEDLDLNGMQCRWDRIPPPENMEEVVTLLVVAREAAQQQIIFGDVMKLIDQVYGAPPKRQPISVAKLQLKTTFNRLGKEMRTRIGKIKLIDLIYLWGYSIVGKLYFKTKKGKHYLTRLVEMSDTLVIDGKINTVISGTSAQRNELQNALDKLESEGKIVYGMHVSNSSIMSCYVRDLEDGHIHFVDGAEGGYTLAAGMLKKK